MPLKRSGNAGTGQAPEVGHESDSPGIPSPMSLNYYTYKDVPYACDHCGWRGKGSELEQGEMFEALFELNCPVGPPSLRENHGFRKATLHLIASHLQDNLADLCRQWRKIHGNY